MAASLPRTTVWLLSISLLLGVCIEGCTGQKSGPAKPQVLYLHTEFLPYKTSNDTDLSNRLNREVIRQALLVAARDGMKLPTCDETLQESPPDDADVVHLSLTERSHPDGKWHVKLCKFVEGQDIDAAPALWEKTYDFTASNTKMYADMVPKLDVDIRGALIDALKSAGLRAEKPAQNDTKQVAPSADIERLLLVPDFVAQFGVVRAAHQAILAHGETPEWLSVLTRGYANLATLTHHHWNSATEVFTARAWLYGQRMAAADAQSSFALWNRAYAWALGGTFHHALADIERVEKLPAADAHASPSDRDWSKLIKPFASSNRAEVKKLGTEINELKPWSAYLDFELCNFARYSEWMYQAADEVGGSCPTAYGVFDELAHHGQQLGVVRMGAGVGPKAFAHFIPITLGEVPGLPAEIRDLLPTDKTKQDALLKLAGDVKPDQPFSSVPGLFAAMLRERSRQQREGDLSWSALASLVEEEQFVQAAVYMNVATNATETSLQGDVDALLPLVKDHRYAAYIESFSLGNVRDPARLFGYFGKMVVRDPRENMYPMFSRIGYLKNANGPIGPALINSASRNFTLPDIVEFLFPAGPGAMSVDSSLALVYANEATTIAPGSPVGARLLVQTNPSPQPDDLKAWEKAANDDSITLLALAQQHVKLGNKDDAVRCWEKSIAALPSVSSTLELAAFHREQGDLKKWEETLTAFLKTEDLGLQHSVVQQDLALGFARDGDWKKAKPYALAAAQTYSCNGLRVGGYITEGLAEWNLSEQLIRAAATNYATNDGAEWYLWCRRNGRGDLKSAEQLAVQYFALPQPHPTDDTFMLRGLYDALTGKLQAARDSFQQALNIKRTFTCTCLVAQLSRELKDDATRAEVIAAMEQEVADPADKTARTPEIDRAGMLILDLLKNGNPSPERLASLDDALLKIGEPQRISAVGWCYFIGTELEALGKEKEAEKYWRRALIDSNRHAVMAVLAGDKLAKHNGKSRPDDDALDADDLWPPKAK